MSDEITPPGDLDHQFDFGPHALRLHITPLSLSLSLIDGHSADGESAVVKRPDAFSVSFNFWRPPVCLALSTKSRGRVRDWPYESKGVETPTC